MPAFGGGGLGGAGLGGMALPLVFAWGSTAWEPPFTTLTADLTTGATTIAVAYDLPVYSVPFDVVIGLEMLTVTARPTATSWTVTRGARGSSTLPAADRVHFAGARVSGLPHTIVVTKGVTTWDFTAIANNLRTREVSPGGELEATWELDTMDPAAWLASVDAPVLISDESGAYWSGLIARPGVKKRGDFYHVNMVARGFIVTGGWDVYDDSRIWPAYTAGHTIISESRNEKCPFISTSNTYVIHGGQSIATPLEGIGSTPRQLWDRVCAAGDVGEPLDFHVRTADDASVNLHLLRRVSQPTIKIPWATLKSLPFEWDAELQRTKVVVRYSKGRTPPRTLPGATVTRTIYKDYSGQIDNLDLAWQIAGQILANTSVLGAIAGEAFVVEWPKEVLDEDDVPIPVWRIRAGWMVEFPDISPWNADLPIPLLQIVGVDCDHEHHRVSLQLGSRDDDLALEAAYTAQEAAKLGAPTSGIIPQFVVPPEGVSTPFNTDLVSFGASGTQVGYAAVADDADISTIWVALDGLDALPAVPYRLPDIPIDVQMYVRGFRLRARDAATGPVSIQMTVGHGAAAGYPALGATIDAPIAVSVGNEENRDIPEDDIELLLPGDYLTLTIDSVSDATVGSLGILVQRLGGSTRATAGASPTISSVVAARDLSNNVVFTIGTSRLAQCQIEYGPTTLYKSRSNRSDQWSKSSTIVVRGVTAGAHYVVHAWDVDEHEAISADATV